MTPAAYLDAIKERLVTDPFVLRFHIRRERVSVQDGFIRARLFLSDESMLEFAEYFQVTEAGDIEVVTYSYHWADAEGTLLRRWDNTPHYPGLDGFPHHVHVGESGKTLPSQPMTLFRVLDVLTGKQA